MQDAIREELQALVESLADTDPARAAVLSKLTGFPVDRHRIRIWRTARIPEAAVIAAALLATKPRHPSRKQ